MSTKTKNLELYKWDLTNSTDLESRFDVEKSLNENWDKIDDAVGNKVDKVEGKDLSSNDYTNEEKEKLSALENYDDTEVKRVINSLIKENTSLKNQIPLGQAEGESITIDDSSDLPINNAEIGGKIEQETREGYNLIKIEATTVTKNGITFTVNEDGSIVANGTATENATLSLYSNFKAISSGSYRLTGTPENGSDTTYKMMLWKTGWKSAGNDFGSGLNLTLSEDTTIQIQIIITSGITVNNLVFKPMLVAGTEEKTYEQYGAMPSIEYPSPIKSVSGENEVKIQNKNLFNVPDKSFLQAGVNSSFNNNVLTINGTCTASDWLFNDTGFTEYTARFIKLFKIKKSKTFTISLNKLEGSLINGEMSVIFRGIQHGTPIITTEKCISKLLAGESIVITIPDDSILGFSIWNIANNVANNLKLQFQIEEGTQATNFVEHQEQSYPISLGDIELYEEGFISIDYEEKAGYKTVTGASVHNNYFKEKISTNNTIIYSTLKDDIYYCVQLAPSTPIKVKAKIFCNNFKYVANGWSVLSENVSFGSSQNNKLQFKILASRLTDTSSRGIRDFLIEKNTEVVYELETPTKTEITDETLLQQLEALINAETYKNITHVDTTGEDLTPNIQVVYRKDLETMFNKMDTLESRIALLEA